MRRRLGVSDWVLDTHAPHPSLGSLGLGCGVTVAHPSPFMPRLHWQPQDPIAPGPAQLDFERQPAAAFLKPLVAPAPCRRRRRRLGRGRQSGDRLERAVAAAGAPAYPRRPPAEGGGHPSPSPRPPATVPGRQGLPSESAYAPSGPASLRLPVCRRLGRLRHSVTVDAAGFGAAWGPGPLAVAGPHCLGLGARG